MQREIRIANVNRERGEAIYNVLSRQPTLPLRSFVHNVSEKVLTIYLHSEKLIAWLDVRKLLSYGKKVLDYSAYEDSDWTSTTQARYTAHVAYRADCGKLASEFVRLIETRLKMACHYLRCV